MKQFSLEEYLKNPSRQVVTRFGKRVQIICIDYKSTKPIIGLVEKNEEYIYTFTKDGKLLENGERSFEDLFFLPIKKEGWVNIYDITRTNCISRIYKTKEEAETIGKGCKSGYITTTKIEWEE